MPELFEIVVNPQDGFEHLPKPDVPYYVYAEEGRFLYKHTQIGDALLKDTKPLRSLGKIGYKDGVFMWEGDKIPGAIISQAHDFFRRIYVAHHAEAEVLITKHNETGAYRLFVPFQRVSHGGVKSIYEPSHVDRDYTVVGTLHSHCDFSAFHSGTDSGDASDMDGVHFTIGKVLQHPKPEIVCMVAMNGNEFHYRDPSIIAEIEFDTATAPPWWDQYVFPGDEAPKEKPKSLVSLTQDHWDEFLGRALMARKTTTTSWSGTPKSPGSQYGRGEWSPGPGWEKVGNSWMRKHEDPKPYASLPPYSGNYRSFDEDRWLREWREADKPSVRAESKDRQIQNAIELAEEMGFLNDDEWMFINGNDVDDPKFWRHWIMTRMANLREVLEALGDTPRERRSRRRMRSLR